MITSIKKRDGHIVEFQRQKIEDAIFKAAKAVGGNDRAIAYRLTDNMIYDFMAKGPKKRSFF